MKQISYYIKRKWWQIKNVFRWLPVIWDQYDFDYIYAIEVFKFQLLKTTEFLEGPEATGSSSSYRAKRIKTLIKLMDKVYNEEYACEYQDKIKEKYGNYEYKLVPDAHNHNYYEHARFWEMPHTKEKLIAIEKEEKELFLKSQQKQDKAHRIMWQIVEKDIRGWWD